MILVEGRTESRFVSEVLADYLAIKGIYARPTLLDKPGQKGGDVKFIRAKRDIGNHLKQWQDSYVSIFVDYYGIKSDWPGLNTANEKVSPSEIAKALNEAATDIISEEFAEQNAKQRFIPFVAVHEFEALLFSDPVILADGIGVEKDRINEILTECVEPEKINNSTETAPSKRLNRLYSGYKKTVTGITIAKAIGIGKMREQCPVFNDWLIRLEGLI